jgi:hypothetical protein
MLEEVLILFNKGLDEKRCLIWHREVVLKNLGTKLGQNTLTVHDLMHVLIVLTSLSDHVIDRFAS